MESESQNCNVCLHHIVWCEQYSTFIGRIFQLVAWSRLAHFCGFPITFFELRQTSSPLPLLFHPSLYRHCRIASIHNSTNQELLINIHARTHDVLPPCIHPLCASCVCALVFCRHSANKCSSRSCHSTTVIAPEAIHPNSIPSFFHSSDSTRACRWRYVPRSYGLNRVILKANKTAL